MDYQLELKIESLENMIIVYQEHIDQLEIENKVLKDQVDFLKQQLEYKTMGLPETTQNESKEP